MTQSSLQERIIKESAKIAKILSSGKDCELRTDATGLKVISVTKKVIK